MQGRQCYKLRAQNKFFTLVCLVVFCVPIGFLALVLLKMSLKKDQIQKETKLDYIQIRFVFTLYRKEGKLQPNIEPFHANLQFRFLKEYPCLGRIHYLGGTSFYGGNTWLEEISLPNDYQKNVCKQMKIQIFNFFFFFTVQISKSNLNICIFFIFVCFKWS